MWWCASLNVFHSLSLCLPLSLSKQRYRIDVFILDGHRQQIECWLEKCSISSFFPLVFLTRPTQRHHSNVPEVVATLSLAEWRNLKHRPELGIASRRLLSQKLPQLSRSEIGRLQKHPAAGVTKIHPWTFRIARNSVAIQVLLNIPLQRAEIARIGLQVNLSIVVAKKQALLLTETHDAKRTFLRRGDSAPHCAYSPHP